MRCVLQRVRQAHVTVDGEQVAAIEHGFLALIGVERGDGPADAVFIASKIQDVRVFAAPDGPGGGGGSGKMTSNLAAVSGSVLLVSQFTLFGDLTRGRRPSFDAAAPPAEATVLYEAVARSLRDAGHRVETGRFGAHMQVHLINDGPVTLLLDSRRRERQGSGGG